MPNSQVRFQLDKNTYDAYGSVDTEDNLPKFKPATPGNKAVIRRRWSVLEKVYSRPHRWFERCNLCTKSRWFLSTAMLAIFSIVAFATIRFLWHSHYRSDIGPKRYDYIIVGGGPAGSIISRKLSLEGYDVLLLEAGEATQYDLGGTDYFGGPITRFDIPLLWTYVSHSKEFSWEESNTPAVLVAKGLGGSGIHNAMVYVRALEEDILRWNITGWNWKTVLRTYIELEEFVPLYEDENIPLFHGRNGLIKTSRPPYIDETAPEFISAAVQYGIPYTSDFNAPGKRAGVGHYHFNIAGGTRESAAKKCLVPLLQPGGAYPNFKLLLSSTVTKILYSSWNSVDGLPSVSGVEYMSADNEVHAAYLKPSEDNVNARSVILTAGALLSPAILMRSGIGPRERLEGAGVDIKVVLEGVGRNLQDHPVVGVIMKTNPALSGRYPSAYSIAAQWGRYIEAVVKARSSTSTSNTPNTIEFGVLGSSGITAGVFLCSPYATRKRVDVTVDPMKDKEMDGDHCTRMIPDIQLTVFPTVEEPHLRRHQSDFPTAMPTPQPVPLYNNGNSYNRTSPPTSSPTVTTTTTSSSPSSSSSSSTPITSTSTTSLMLVTACLLDPDAKLEVTLSINDINKLPSMELPIDRVTYLSTRDVKRLVWAVEQIRNIMATPPMDLLTERETTPGVEVVGDSLEEWVRANALSNSHWVGTVKMGNTDYREMSKEVQEERSGGRVEVEEVDKEATVQPEPKESTISNNNNSNENDNDDILQVSQATVRKQRQQDDKLWKEYDFGAVVDSHLRVRGVQGLRVADASVIPTVPNGNVHSTVLMVASRAADKIIAQHNLELRNGR